MTRRGIFITGTDTGVGKTVVCTSLLAAGARQGAWGYWKPVQTGDDDDAATVRAHTPAVQRHRVLDAGCHFTEPASPHHAAALEGKHVDVSTLSRLWSELPQGAWVVEGAGGWMVPLNAHELWGDFVDALDIGVLLVASTRLGCINHTLLSLSAIGRRAIGVIMVGPFDPSAWTGIEAHTDVPIVGHLEYVSPLTASVINDWGESLWQGDCGAAIFRSIGQPRDQE